MTHSRLAALAFVLPCAMLAAGRSPGTVAGQVIPPPTVETAVPATEPPSPPTALATTPAPAPAPPTRPPERERDEEPEAPAPGPQPTGVDTPEGGPTATRTRRPTRTPRTTPSPSPTALVAGGLRMTTSARPSPLVAGGRVEMVVRLQNLTDGRAADLTVQVVLPGAVVVDGVEPGPGLYSRSGPYVRWYVPGIGPGRAEELRLLGFLTRVPDEGVPLCALLLSGGSPVEHCSILAVGSGAPGAGTPAPAEPPTAEVPAAVTQTGLALDVGALGWGVLLLGLGVLGVALGLRRSRG